MTKIKRKKGNSLIVFPEDYIVIDVEITTESPC